jgi:hypothetical protein
MMAKGNVSTTGCDERVEAGVRAELPDEAGVRAELPDEALKLRRKGKITRSTRCPG